MSAEITEGRPGINTHLRGFVPVKNKLPGWGQWVMVKTHDGQCVGFLDPQGAWRSARDGSIIENVESWHAFDPPGSRFMRHQHMNTSQT